MKTQFLLLAALRFVKLALTVASLVIYGRTFGIGLQMDAWVFATGVAASVGLALWGPVNEIVRSRFVRMAADSGEALARSAARSLLIFTTGASLVVCLVLLALAPHIVGVLYAASEPVTSSLVLTIFALMLPSIFVGQVVGLGGAYMNCYEIIYPPELMGVAAAALNVVCVLALSPHVGIYSLVWGYYLGAGASLVIVLRFLHTHGFWHRSPGASPILADTRAAFLFAAPLFLSYVAGQLNGLLEKYLASLMGVGVVSSVNYASQIKSTLQAVLTSVMFSLIVPKLTQAASQLESEGFSRMLIESQRVALLFLLAILPFVFGTADALAVLLFGKAAHAAGALQEITLLIRLYAVALVPVVLYLVYGMALLAQQKGGAYAALGVAVQVVSAALSVLLFRAMGAAIFPIALAVSALLASLLMLQRVDFCRRCRLLGDAAALFAAMVVSALTVKMGYQSLSSALDSSALGMSVLSLAYVLALGVGALLYRFKWDHA